MVALLLSEGTNPVGEGQRVGEARELENPLEPSDAVALQQTPVPDLRPKLGDLSLGHPRRVSTAGGAALSRQCADGGTPGVRPVVDPRAAPVAAAEVWGDV